MAELTKLEKFNETGGKQTRDIFNVTLRDCFLG
jgi:hypothetical protein